MALCVGELFAELKLDDRGFNTRVAQAKTDLQGLGRQATTTEGFVKGLSGTLGSVGRLAAGAAAGGVVADV